MNGVAGARFRALAALNALFVIDYRQVVYHFDRARRAGLCAFAARDTSELANVHYRFSFIVRGTCDINFCVCGNAFEQALGASRKARAARSAPIGIYACAFFL